MSRNLAICIIWLLGFGIGFGGYLVFPNLTSWFQNIVPYFLDKSLLGAIIAGLIGSILSTVTIVTWANKTA